MLSSSSNIPEPVSRGTCRLVAYHLYLKFSPVDIFCCLVSLLLTMGKTESRAVALLEKPLYTEVLNMVSLACLCPAPGDLGEASL